MTSQKKQEREEEQRISITEEQVLSCPKKRIAVSQEATRNMREEQTQQMKKLLALLRELRENKKFFDNPLTAYEAGQTVPVKKMQYIRLSRGSPGEEESSDASRHVKSRRDKR